MNRFSIALILAATSAAAVGGTGMQLGRGNAKAKDQRIHSRHLLKDSTCTLTRKCVTYEPDEDHPEIYHKDSWSCQLSGDDAESLGTSFLDIVETSTNRLVLDKANPGKSTLTINEAVADTDRLELHLTEDTQLRIQDIPLAEAAPNDKTPSKTGTHKALMIRIIDGDGLMPGKTAPQLAADLFDDNISLKTQISACSYEQLKIEPFVGATPSGRQIGNGVVNIRVYGYSSADNGFVGKAQEAAKDELGNLDDERFGLVMYCLPENVPGIAWAYANRKYSFYRNEWCSAVGALMHEVGHNVGLGHSGQIDQDSGQINDNGDGTGVMGMNPGRHDVEYCYNAQKSYQLGWYSDKTATIDPLRGSGTREFRLNGISDYGRSNNLLIVLRLEQTDFLMDYYIGYNVAEGINADVKEDRNKLTIIRKDKGGPDDYGQSTKMASLIPGQKYVIQNFNEEEDVQVTFLGLKNGNAEIAVGEVDDNLPDFAYDGKCKNITIELTTDNRPTDTSWFITEKKKGKVVTYSPIYEEKKKLYRSDVCLPRGISDTNYQFTILDESGDGLKGSVASYAVYDADTGNVLFSGREFSTKLEHSLEVPKDGALSPSNTPTLAPSAIPTISEMPSVFPSTLPSAAPSSWPSAGPTPFCYDDPNYEMNGKKSKNCEWIRKELTWNRCTKFDVVDHCRATCHPDCITPAPSAIPSGTPTSPTVSPSSTPSLGPSDLPSYAPSNLPSQEPSNLPSVSPSSLPSFGPSLYPSATPSGVPSRAPSSIPSTLPSTIPSMRPSGVPSKIPSTIPSTLPSVRPSDSPSWYPSGRPSGVPSVEPSDSPSFAPSDAPSDTPSHHPSTVPSDMPSVSAYPSDSPSLSPSDEPTISEYPSEVPSCFPSDFPSLSAYPSASPSSFPSVVPSAGPSSGPSSFPSDFPSVSAFPSVSPSSFPSVVPSAGPSLVPSAFPSDMPSAFPSVEPSSSPSVVPTDSPTDSPTPKPSCKDQKLKWGSKKKDCKWVGDARKKTVKERCREKWKGKTIHWWCPKTCGKVGVGKCKK